jgi:predicted metal-dependent hydrolase
VCCLIFNVFTRRKRIAPKITLVHGAEIPLLGNTYRILFQEDRLKGVQLGTGQLIVSHPYNRHHMLLTMWLKQKSLHFLSAQSKLCAEQLEVRINRIAIREVRSRWGSCSHQKNLSYSWRLIFAPEEVANYVCAHEVAHLIHMNHSREFWKTVELICEDYKTHRQWLRTHGQTLFLFN